MRINNIDATKQVIIIVMEIISFVVGYALGELAYYIAERMCEVSRE